MINYLDLKYQLLQKSHYLDRSKLVEVERTFTKRRRKAPSFSYGDISRLFL